MDLQAVISTLIVLDIGLGVAFVVAAIVVTLLRVEWLGLPAHRSVWEALGRRELTFARWLFGMTVLAVCAGGIFLLFAQSGTATFRSLARDGAVVLFLSSTLIAGASLYIGGRGRRIIRESRKLAQTDYGIDDLRRDDRS